MAGSLFPNSQLIKIVEEAGASVVGDDLCFGSRYFEGNVEKGDHPLSAISKRYLFKSPCPRMKDTDVRLESAKKIRQEMKADGIIYQTLKFCDNHLYDYPFYRELFEKKGIPILQIEEDFMGGNLGQIKTRIEAFIEML